MTQRCVIRFNGTTTPSSPHTAIGFSGSDHSFGFSESHWLAGDTTFLQAKNWLRNKYGPTRKYLLPSQCRMVDALVYADGDGQGAIVPLGIVGAGGPTDQPNVAMLCTSSSPVAAAQRHWWVHCLPDAFVQNGELALTNLQAESVQDYFNALKETAWYGLTRTGLVKVRTISAAGLVTADAVHTFVVGDTVRITRTVTPDSRQHGYEGVVSAIGPLPTQLTLTGWTLGDTVRGKMFKPDFGFISMGSGNGPIAVRSGTKRVGRPFGAFRGRQPVRRS